MIPAKTGDEPSAPSITRALVLVLAMLLYNYASDRAWDWLGVSDVNWDSPWKVPLLSCGWLFSIVGVVWGGIVVWGKTSLRELGWTFVPTGRLAAAGLLLATVMIGLVVAVYRVFGGPTGIDDLAHTLASYSPGRRVFFAVMGVKIAFVEESVFRGDLIRSLRTRLGTAGAVVVAAAIFAVWHRSFNPVSLAMKAVFGLLMGVTAVRTKSLAPSALAHALMWAVLGTA